MALGGKYGRASVYTYECVIILKKIFVIIIVCYTSIHHYRQHQPICFQHFILTQIHLPTYHLLLSRIINPAEQGIYNSCPQRGHLGFESQADGAEAADCKSATPNDRITNPAER